MNISQSDAAYTIHTHTQYTTECRIHTHTSILREIADNAVAFNELLHLGVISQNFRCHDVIDVIIMYSGYVKLNKYLVITS